ncbi:DNA polymerase delta subunit 3 [Parasteatoda tepidariorum]|uniref:DNA polymerase delta subunit 3 n=1 Tax=Parasteatoda tepidariorum TaxID=114398 RepID=UPI00077F9842|nr:DNA polymerase delta subunit 3 [Parasteatoda tepidariorum]
MPPEECFDKLEQLILDENELVTYKMLSKELKIHVNEAKKFLSEFFTAQSSKGEMKLFAHYFLSGFIVKDGFRCKKIIIVSEEKLEQIKKEFDEVDCIHIYSVNKGGSRDDSSIFNSQSWCKKWAEEHREYSAIKHTNIKIQAPALTKTEVKKNDAKVVSSKLQPVKTKMESVPSIFQSNKNEVKSNSVSSNRENSSSEVANASENMAIESKSSNSAKSNPESKDPKKSTLSSLWQKLEDKTKNGKSENSKLDSKGKNKMQSSSKTVGKNNIMSMFSKQAERNAANPIKKLPDAIPTLEKTNNNNVPSNVEKEFEKLAVVKNKSKSKTSQRKTKRSSKPVSDNDSEEDVKPKKKKHRRICTMDDSDSESENEEEQDRAQRLMTATDNDDVPMALSDSEEPIPPTPPVLPNKGRAKVWKSVQKTYQDEDGFLVAKQEKVLVSGSDSDEDPLPKKKSVSKEEPKQNTFSYRKQASLTSFFKQQ